MNKEVVKIVESAEEHLLNTAIKQRHEETVTSVCATIHCMYTSMSNSFVLVLSYMSHKKFQTENITGRRLSTIQLKHIENADVSRTFSNRTAGNRTQAHSY